ncbi:hypothetical protein CKA32_002827 [Geitlerinema sp. FC II]|nr:hypothetical protein CKA32_002827 [Geitlerinema sp. FC II]
MDTEAIEGLEVRSLLAESVSNPCSRSFSLSSLDFFDKYFQ